MGLWEWDFCLKFLSTPTKTLLLLFEAHTHAECWAKITNIQSTYHIFNAIIQKYTHENLLILYYFLGLSIAFLWTAFSLF